MLTLLVATLVSAGPVAAGPVASAVGPSPISLWEQWKVTRKDAPDLDVYVAGHQQKRPLVVLVQGSWCIPTFMLGPSREVSTLPLRDAVPVETRRVAIAVVDRRGLKSFGAPPASEEEGRRMARCSATHGGVSKAERVQDVADVVVALAAQPWVGPVWVLGHSEGADVAAGVARVLGHRIAGVGLLSGAGPTRFFDDVAVAHRHNDLNAARQALADLISITSDHPPAEYAGASVVRQITYAVDSTSLDDLRETSIPIFVAGGTRDEKSPIESADLFVAEMLRNRSRRLRYLMLPGLDHTFTTSDGDDQSVKVMAAFLDWALSAEKDRSVFVGYPPPRP